MKRNFLSLEQIGEEYSSYAEDLRRGTPTAVFGVSDSTRLSVVDVKEFGKAR